MESPVTIVDLPISAFNTSNLIALLLVAYLQDSYVFLINRLLCHYEVFLFISGNGPRAVVYFG